MLEEPAGFLSLAQVRLAILLVQVTAEDQEVVAPPLKVEGTTVHFLPPALLNRRPVHYLPFTVTHYTGYC